MSKKPVVVFRRNPRKTQTTVVLFSNHRVRPYIVKHFEIEDGVLIFETKDGLKIATNRPFLLVESVLP